MIASSDVATMAPSSRDSRVGASALCDVPRNRDLHDSPVRMTQRGGVCLHMPPGSVQTDHIEFEGSLFAAADSLIHGTEALTIFFSDQIINALPQSGLRRMEHQSWPIPARS